MEIITINNIRQIKATEGKYLIRKIDADNFFTAGIMLDDESESDFVEVDSIPSDDVRQAIADKLDEIEAYDKSDSVNSFYLNGVKMKWLDKDTRVGLMLRFNAEKSAGKTTTTLWFGTISITGNIDSLIQMMYALEVYASACYDNTAQHKASVYALNIVSEIENYDFTAGYPAMLRFNL